MEKSNTKMKYKSGLLNKIVFYITSFTFVHNVIALCLNMNKDDYMVIIDYEQNKHKSELQKKYYKCIDNIFNKYNIGYAKKSFINYNKDNIIFKYKYWFFAKPYNIRGHYNIDLIVVKHLRRINKKIEVLVIQAGIILPKIDYIKQYSLFVDNIITFGNYWGYGRNYRANILSFGSPKISLYKNISEKYFLIFAQPFLRFLCNTKEWGNLDHIDFFKQICDSIVSVHGNDALKNTIIVQHPTAYFTDSEKYIQDLAKKLGVGLSNPDKTVDLINNMKVGFTYCSNVALELRASNKEIIIFNPKFTRKHFPFYKHSFKVAKTKDEIIEHMKSEKLTGNINNLMVNDNPAKKVIDYLINNK